MMQEGAVAPIRIIGGNSLQEDIADRIHIMLKDEQKLKADSCYIEKVQKNSMASNFRRRITEWLLAVSFTTAHLFQV
jgi:hypothetical protein